MDAAAEFAQQTFDYIVVGGGNTGLPLASLLSADPDVRVGVIEAGLRKDDDMILVPGLIGKPMNNPEYDWMLHTNSQSLANLRQLKIPRGKVLGGTSALNNMVYTRGSKIEFNDWEKLGITGWNWDTIRDSITAAESWTPPSDLAKSYHADDVAQNHGKDGYIKTTAYSYYYDLARPFFDTMNEIGVATNPSEASGDPIGVWTFTASVDPETNTRSYSTNAYYDRVSHRPNIVCLTGAHVSRVVMSDSKDGVSRATGVEFYFSGRQYSVSVHREVILSAGALQTPQLLELSGIGNPKILKDLGIPLKIDLPGVGENFQDHFTVKLGAELAGNHITTDDMSSPQFAQERLQEYKETRQGMLSSTLSTLAFIPASAFIPPDKMKSILAALDEALQAPEMKNSPYRECYELQRSWLKNDGVAQLEVILFPAYKPAGFNCPKEGAKHYTMAVFLQHAWSRGTIHAKSTSIFHSPEIDLATFDSPGDIDLMMMLEAVKYAVKVVQTGALANLTVKIVEPLPTWTDDLLVHYIRETVQSSWHPIGTASMLPRSVNGVVDSELKVYGTENLRVADASILPIHLGSHPQAMLYGIAHRAAEFITSARKATND